MATYTPGELASIAIIERLVTALKAVEVVEIYGSQMMTDTRRKAVLAITRDALSILPDRKETDDD